MKKLLLLLVLSLGIKTASADNYKVIFVNDASLKYTNGKAVKAGDIIKDVKDINWQKERQAVKTINMTTKKQALFLGKSYIRKKGGGMTDVKPLTTHLEQDEEVMKTIYYKLSTIFDEEYDLLDSIEVSADVPLSDKCYFTATYNYGDTEITKRLNSENGKVIIDKSIFNIVDKQLEPCDIKLSIDYKDGNKGITIFVKDNITLSIIPEKLE